MHDAVAALQTNKEISYYIGIRRYCFGYECIKNINKTGDC